MTRQQQNNDHPEANVASQKVATYQPNTNGGQRQFPITQDEAPMVPSLLERYNDLSPTIQAMGDRTTEQMFAVAFKFYKAKHTAHGLKKLHVEVNELHADAKIANEWTEARVAGTALHSDVAQFNMQTEDIFREQLRSLLLMTGDQCVKEVAKSSHISSQEKQKNKGLLNSLADLFRKDHR